MAKIEFYTNPDGSICAMHDGKIQVIDEKCTELLDDVTAAIEKHYPEAYAALRKLYAKSAANPRYFKYKVTSRFIRCNLGEIDTLQYDFQDGMINVEQVHCPLRGTGECKLENIVCMPKRGSVLTGRQLEIASLLANGLNCKAIAQRLFISINTVRNMIVLIKNRLKVEHTAQIITWYNLNVKL